MMGRVRESEEQPFQMEDSERNKMQLGRMGRRVTHCPNLPGDRGFPKTQNSRCSEPSRVEHVGC